MRVFAIATLALCVSSPSLLAKDVADESLPDSPEKTATKLIERLEALEKIDANGRKIQRVYRREDGTISSLRFFDLELSDHEFHAIATFRDLQSIDFSKSNLSDRHLAYFTQMPHLVNIRTHMTKISDAGIKHVINYPKLRSICMGKVNVSYSAWTKVKALHQAKYKTERQIAGGPTLPRKN